MDGATSFDNNLAFGRVDAEDGAFFALVVTGDDFDLVAFFDVCLDGAHGKMLRGLENLWCEGDDLHELLFTELTGDGAEDPGAAWVIILVDDDDGVRIKTKD